MSKKYYKDKSLYTIKNVHTKTNKGTIYENDYVTIIQNDGIYDEIPLFSESNFKFKISENNNNKKRHVKSNWILNDKGDSIWTKNDVKNNIISDESKIVLKPNYTSLKDFAYFGSAVELIKTTIKDIILRFPGGIYYYGDDAPIVKVLNNDIYEEWYLVSNECEIDCWTNNITNLEKGVNPLHYLFYSYDKYGLNNPPVLNLYDTNQCFNTIIGEININGHNLSIYKDGSGNNHLLTNTKKKGEIIKPKEEFFNEFWNNLDDFERILLNKENNYTAIFDTPYKTDYGYFYTPKSYTWPIINENQIDLSTSNFVGYLNSLIELATFHDDYDTDNIWRMMTHESIKNLDWTYSTNDETLEDIDNSRMKSMIRIQGRQYDDIKRYADNIKTINSITYDEKNNIPDYFLSDIIENKGWDSKNINLNENNSNSIFLRRLALSSKYIHSTKGTKNSVETILKIFGFTQKEYEIIEYSTKVESPIDYDNFACTRAKFDYVNGDEMVTFIEGYPLAMIKDEQNNISLVPWYDKNQKYEGDFYYQCKGGWGKTNKMEIKRNDLTSLSSITYNSIYRESEPYMLFANNLNEMLSFPNDKIKNGIICYVADITGIENYNKGNKDKKNQTFSNYFILENKSLSPYLGFYKDNGFNCYGWYNIKKEEYDGTSDVTNDGKQVLYLESLIPNYKDNNPHTGRGDYDFGKDYLNKYKKLFREAIKDGRADGIEGVENIGFIINTINKHVNGKCENYINNDEENSLLTINLKNLTIKFPLAKDENDIQKKYKKYIINNIIPYIESIIPSSVIIEYLFGDEESSINDILNEDNVRYNPLPADINTNDNIIWAENEDWK